MGTPTPSDSPSGIEVLAVAFSLRGDQLCALLTQARRAAEHSLPAADLRAGLSLEDCARERIFGLTGLRETYQEQLYTYGEPGRGKVSVAYYALLPARFEGKHDTHPPIHLDEERAAWFPLDNLPGMSGDHAEILAYALRRLRYKLEYTAVGFQLLPEAFTLSQLQKTYEIILGETLDKRNFRRRILEAGIIEPTAALRGGEGRPARLFRYRPDAVAEVKTRRLFP